MKSFNDMKYDPLSEKIVSIIGKKVQNTQNPLFFRILTAYYLTKITSMMRCNIETKDRGIIPVSAYAINLAPSGLGKGFSTNLIEDSIINKFREKFLHSTFVELANQNLAKLAIERALKKDTDDEKELEAAEKEFEALGELLFSFDSGTVPAIKQMRHKLLMANAGSMNLEMDEIGSNLLKSIDVLNAFLELFDVGKLKQKLIKNTADSRRNEDIEGKTPTNMLLFGTPSKLLNGGKEEEEFYTMLETGYARRCMFGLSSLNVDTQLKTPEEIYKDLTESNLDKDLEKISLILEKLAGKQYFNINLTMDKDVTILCIKYKISCEERARELSDYEEMRKAELTHRYFKTLKLAGTYAFINGSSSLETSHLESAIKLMEDSGTAFQEILTRPKNFEKLAKYIAATKRELTYSDLVEELPFYKGTESSRKELMNLAIAYGYKNNIIIRKTVVDGIDFIKGEELEKTNLDKIIISYSTDITEGYKNATIKFSDLFKLTSKDDYHYTTHHLLDGYRKSSNCLPKFNLVVLDVENSINMETAKLLLAEYTYLIHETKRHTDEHNRYRIILPLSHVLKLEDNVHKEFLNNVYDWLPFEVDRQTNDYARKWATNSAPYYSNQGDLLNALLFIPQTKKAEHYKTILEKQSSLGALEKWFYNNTNIGSRNNKLLRFAFMLVETGYDYNEVKERIFNFNNKLPDKLDEIEIHNTIFQSVAKAIAKRDN